MKVTLRWTIYVTLFALPFLALLVPNGMFFPFITGKNFGFRILVEVAFSAWVALTFLDRRYRPQFSWMLVAYGLFIAWLFVADYFFAVNPHKALWSNFERMDGWVTLIHLFGLFLVASSVFGADSLWRKWWLTFTGSALLITLFGFVQILCKHATCGAPGALFSIHQSAERIDATLGNSEYIAGFLLFAIAICFWLAASTLTKPWLRYSLFVVAALDFIILFESGTRGTLIGIVVAAGAGAVVYLFNAPGNARRGGFAVIAAVLLLIGGFYAVRNSSYVQNNTSLQHLATIFSLKEQLSTRTVIWTMALEGAKEKPITGWGQEGYNYVFNQYYQPSLYSQEPWFDRAHDLFLDWLVAGGVPALLLFVALLVTAFTGIFRSRQYSWIERIILFSALVGYTIQGLVVFDNLFTYIPLAALLAMIHTNTARPIAKLEAAPEVTDPTLSGTLVVLAIVAAAGLIWTVNIPTIQASSDLITALTPSNSTEARFASFKQAFAENSFASQEINEQLVQFAATVAGDTQVPDALKQEIASYAVQQMAAEVARAPQDARLRQQYATLLRSFGQYDAAEKESAAAHTLSPNKQSIIFEQGIERLQAGDAKGASQFFTQAYELDHHDADAAGYAAAGHILTGDVPGAKALLQKQFGTPIVNQNIIIVAYYQTKDWNNLILTLLQKQKESDDGTTGLQLAGAYAEAGRLTEAKAEIQTTIAAHPETQSQGASLLAQINKLPVRK
jgi:O-antigen ligase